MRFNWRDSLRMSKVLALFFLFAAVAINIIEWCLYHPKYFVWVFVFALVVIILLAGVETKE